MIRFAVREKLILSLIVPLFLAAASCYDSAEKDMHVTRFPVSDPGELRAVLLGFGAHGAELVEDEGLAIELARAAVADTGGAALTPARDRPAGIASRLRREIAKVETAPRLLEDNRPGGGEAHEESRDEHDRRGQDEKRDRSRDVHRPLYRARAPYDFRSGPGVLAWRPGGDDFAARRDLRQGVRELQDARERKER